MLKGSLRIGKRAKQDERRIPDTLGVLWNEDQSHNQIVVDLRFSHDYRFSPVQDIALTREYVDQLAEALFS